MGSPNNDFNLGMKLNFVVAMILGTLRKTYSEQSFKSFMIGLYYRCLFVLRISFALIALYCKLANNLISIQDFEKILRSIQIILSIVSFNSEYLWFFINFWIHLYVCKHSAVLRKLIKKIYLNIIRNSEGKIDGYILSIFIVIFHIYLLYMVFFRCYDDLSTVNIICFKLSIFSFGLQTMNLSCLFLGFINQLKDFLENLRKETLNKSCCKQNKKLSSEVEKKKYFKRIRKSLITICKLSKATFRYFRIPLCILLVGNIMFFTIQTMNAASTFNFAMYLPSVLPSILHIFISLFTPDIITEKVLVSIYY